MCGKPPRNTSTKGEEKSIALVEQSSLKKLRNLQKRANKGRHECEKEYMVKLDSSGCAVGKYMGDGQGDAEDELSDVASVVADVDAQSIIVDDQSNDEDEDSSDDAKPLLFFYDCETTGLQIYYDHITEVAAEVACQDYTLSNYPSTYSSLVRTNRHIPAAGE